MWDKDSPPLDAGRTADGRGRRRPRTSKWRYTFGGLPSSGGRWANLLGDRGARLEERPKGFQRPVPEVRPFSRDRLGGAMNEMHERLGTLRGEFVRDARLDRSAFLRDRPHERQLAGAIDRRDRSFDATVGEGSFIAAAQLGLHAGIVRPPLNELFRIQKGLKHPWDGGANRDLRVREQDASRNRRLGGARGGGRTGHGLRWQGPRVYNPGGAILSERILAPSADESAVLFALHASAVEEPLSDGRVVAVAHGRDHVPAVVAQVLDRLLAGHVSLIRHQDREHEDERPDDQPDHPALEAPVILEGECGPGGGHATRCRLLVQILMGGSIGG